MCRGITDFLFWPSVFLATFLLIDAQELFHIFAYHNDYRFFELPDGHCCLEHPEARQLIGIGRPLGALLLGVQSIILGPSMEAMWFGRLTSILSIAVCAYLVFKYLVKRFDIGSTEAYFLSAGIFLLPSMQLNTFWVANFVPCILTILITMGAFHCFRARIYLPASLLTICAMLIYPPAFMFFLVLSLFDLVFQSRQFTNVPRTIAGDLGFVFVFSCVYFAITVFCLKPILIYSDPEIWGVFYDHIENDLPEYSFSPRFSILAKMAQITDLAKMSMSLWFDPLSNTIFLIAQPIVAYALINICAFNFEFKSRIFLVPALFALISSPILTAPPVFEIPFRTIFPISSAFYILFFSLYWKFRDRRFGNWVSALSLSVLFAGVIVTVHRIDTVVTNSAYEFATVRTQIAAQLSELTREINVRTLTPLALYYEGFLYRDYRLIAGSMSAPMPGLINAALIDLGIGSNDYAIKFVSDRTLDVAPDRVNVSLQPVVNEASGPISPACDLVAPGCLIEADNLSVTERAFDNAPWRWGLGPQMKIRFISSTRDPRYLRIKAQNLFNTDVSVSVTLNKNVIPLKVLKFSPGGVLDDRIFITPALGMNEIVFEFSEWNHRADIDTNDPRNLAIMFRRLEFTATTE